MDICNITIDDWLGDETLCLNNLLDIETWRKIPLINVNDVQKLEDGKLVRFRGMIQDMFGSEFYLEKYDVLNVPSNQKTTRNGKYRDILVSNQDEHIEFDDENKVLGERQSYVVTSIPGINYWVLEEERKQFKIDIEVPLTSKSAHKRTIEETMEVDSGTGESSPSIPDSKKKMYEKSPESVTSLQKNLIVSQEHILNHPLANESFKVCHLKVYKDFESLKLNNVYDFVGFLTINNTAESLYDVEEGLESEMEFQTHHPPCSLVSKMHVVHFKQIEHINPLVQSPSNHLTDLQLIKKELLLVLTQLLMGDTLCAEYILCTLISEIYSRKDCLPLGKFALNISHVPRLENIDYIPEVYKFIEMLLPVSHYLPLTLQNMNQMALCPKKDYECNRLTSGLLQLSKNMLLVLDETKLKEGKLDATGIANVKALAIAIKEQKVSYDFNYYPMDYDCDIAFLVFSEGKSMLPSDKHIIMNPDNACVETFKEIMDAARHFLKPELLNSIRTYLTQVKLIEYGITDEVQGLVQEEFVKMRMNDGSVTADDLHSLLVLARLICISEGKSTLDEACWEKARAMERERKLRGSR